MKMGLSDVEGRVLHGLVEEASGDIVLRIDPQGFLVAASPNIETVRRDFSSLLLMPHLSDLAEHDHRDELWRFIEQVLAGDAPRAWFEFPVKCCEHDSDCSDQLCHRWYALSLRRIEDAGDEGQGALGLLRSVHVKRSLEGELHSRAVTDPLTGLANRSAFCASLRRHLSEGGGATMVVFAVDSMRAIFMQYGQRTADEIMWGFAKFLEAMALPGHELAQIDSERFAVILTDLGRNDARNWVEEVLKTFSSLALPSSARAPKLTASAGLARVECTVDWTLRQAELGLVMARAGGGSQVAQCHHTPGPAIGSNDAGNWLGVGASARRG